MTDTTQHIDLRTATAQLLDLQGRQHRLKRVTDAQRKVVEVAALAEHDRTGVIPKFRSKGIGEVRIDGIDADPTPYVDDPAEYGSHIAQATPEQTTALVELPADKLEEAMETLKLAGLDPRGARVEVRPAYEKLHLSQLEVVENPSWSAETPEVARFLAVDPDTQEVVPGVRAKVATPRLVVALDRQQKIELEEDADREVEQVLADLTGGSEPEVETAPVVDTPVPDPEPTEPASEPASTEATGEHVCACGRPFRSARGLTSHRRSCETAKVPA